jgi:hypothetical protein
VESGLAKFISLFESELSALARIGVGTGFKQLHFRDSVEAKSRNVADAYNCFIEVRPVIQSDLLSLREILEEGFEVEHGKNGAHDFDFKVEDLD